LADPFNVLIAERTFARAEIAGIIALQAVPKVKPEAKVKFQPILTGQIFAIGFP